MKKLSVHFVTWNSEQYVPLLFESLRKQTFTNWQLKVWDNNSTDRIVAAIKKEIKDFPVDVEILEQKENAGFSGGHNALIRKTESEYVLFLNPDMYLTPDCFERLVAYMDAHADVAACSARLMKWDFEKAADDLEGSFTDVVDSIGLQVFKSRRVVEKDTGKRWSDIKNRYPVEGIPVFGLAGTFPLFRRSALERVAFADGSVLDELYGSYKEDVDLSFRMQWKGMKTVVLRSVIAYHARATGGPKEMGDMAALKNKRTNHSSWVKYYSYKNHLMTLYKNDAWQNLWLDYPWIKWYELKKFFYYLFFDIRVLFGLKEIFKHRKELRQKKRAIKSSGTISWKEMRTWWTKA